MGLGLGYQLMMANKGVVLQLRDKARAPDALIKSLNRDFQC